MTQLVDDLERPWSSGVRRAARRALDRDWYRAGHRAGVDLLRATVEHTADDLFAYAAQVVRGDGRRSTPYVPFAR